MKIYTGKETADTTDPLGTRVVKHMMDVIKLNSQLPNHQLFFDNFFTSVTLMSELAHEGLRSTGTIRENRMSGANKYMIDTKSFKKLERGTYDYASNGQVYAVKWNDNSIVHLVSNHLTHEPIQQTNRRVKGQKNKVSIKQPHIIKQYNEHMGGVDLMDRLLGSYRPMIRGKKWWWPLFLNALNISVVAAWKVHCNVSADKMDHLSFRRSVTLSLLKFDETSYVRKQVGGGATANLPNSVRFDGVGHHKITCSQGRCKICQKNARYKCSKCDVRLHSDKGKSCFEIYHEDV